MEVEPYIIIYLKFSLNLENLMSESNHIDVSFCEELTIEWDTWINYFIVLSKNWIDFLETKKKIFLRTYPNLLENQGVVPLVVLVEKVLDFDHKDSVVEVDNLDCTDFVQNSFSLNKKMSFDWKKTLKEKQNPMIVLFVGLFS